jgi:uncharacterized protein
MRSTIPIKHAERAQILDVLRGFAIFGIFVMNLSDFNFFWALSDVQKASLPLARHDHTTSFLHSMFFEGKFFSIFSMLFGVGFAIFLSKKDQNNSILQTFKRRLTVLLFIGFIHSLFWMGDVVTFYALLGFLLIPFRKFSNKTVLITAVFCILSPIGWYALKMSNPRVFDLSRWLYKWDSDYTSGMGLTKDEDFYQVLHSNDLIQRIKLNFISNLHVYAGRLFTSRTFKVFGMFLLGLVIGRTRFYEKLDQHKKLLWSILLAGFLIGIPANYMMVRLAAVPGYRALTLHGLKQTVAYTIGAASLALAYAAATALLYMNSSTKAILQTYCSRWQNGPNQLYHANTDRRIHFFVARVWLSIVRPYSMDGFCHSSFYFSDCAQHHLVAVF